MVPAATPANKAKHEKDPFYARKLYTGRYFIDRVLPERETLLARIDAGAYSIMAMDHAFWPDEPPQLSTLPIEYRMTEENEKKRGVIHTETHGHILKN